MEFINESPMIRTYLYTAYVESVIGSHKNYRDWLANNYIQVYATKNVENQLCVMDYMAGSVFGGCELLNIQHYDYDTRRKFAENKELMQKELTRLLDDKTAVYLYLDEFYISNRTSYQKEHFVHDALLVRTCEGGFEYIGYDSLGNYAKSVISCDEMCQALHNDNLCTILLRVNPKEYHFNILKFIQMLDEYVHSYDSREHLELYFDMKTYSKVFLSGRFVKELVFGLNTYDTICRLFEYYNQTECFIDWRVLHLIHEHKVSMLYKIQYLEDEGYISKDSEFYESYQEVLELGKKLENMGLKYVVSKREKTNQKIREGLLELKEKETKVLSEVLEVLQAKYVE